MDVHVGVGVGVGDDVSKCSHVPMQEVFFQWITGAAPDAVYTPREHLANLVEYSLPHVISDAKKAGL